MIYDLRYEPMLLEGILLRRYKRFLADVELEGGQRLTVHNPNPGSMRSCCEPGRPVRVSDSRNPKRKLRHTLEQIRMGRTWVGVNTGRQNALVEAALGRDGVPGLSGYAQIRREVSDGDGSRFDFRLEGEGRPPCWIEVKNVTMREGRFACFPDAVTERGRKHLLGLAGLAARGERAVQLYVVSRADVERLRPAHEIDPAYAETLAAVQARGVELLALRCTVHKRGLRLSGALPIELHAREPGSHGSRVRSSR